jgi:hypothetical protein
MPMAMKLGDAAGYTSCRESVRGMVCDSLETQVV